MARKHGGKNNYLAKGVFTYTVSALQQCMLDEPTCSLDDFLLRTVYFTFLLERVNLHPCWHLSPLVEAFFCLSLTFVFLDSVFLHINHSDCAH